MAGVGVRLDRLHGAGTWHLITAGVTDRNGRFGCFDSGGLTTGTYRWVFAAGEFFVR